MDVGYNWGHQPRGVDFMLKEDLGTRMSFSSTQIAGICDGMNELVLNNKRRLGSVTSGIIV